MITSIAEKYKEYMNIISQHVVGYKSVAECFLVSLLAKGHILLEGPPGVAKTTMAKIFSKLVDADFIRVQFTPDLLPTDIVGTLIYDPTSRKFRVRFGPIFTNIFLADEINRASPKTQSALLEAMEERQVTIEGNTYKLEEPFMVIATQNPVEQEGTYPLPEAQLDRFLFKVNIDYPKEEEEIEILEKKFKILKKMDDEKIFTRDVIKSMRHMSNNIHVSETIMNYVASIVSSLRRDSSVAWGPSPRASISLIKVGKVLALLNGRNYVIPEDVEKYADWILSHRIGIGAEYEIEGIRAIDIVRKILETTDIV